MTNMRPTSTFSRAFAFVLAMWLYVVYVVVALPNTSLMSYAWALLGSVLAGSFLEWLRQHRDRNYATAFFILFTLAPIVYRYQHG